MQILTVDANADVRYLSIILRVRKFLRTDFSPRDDPCVGRQRWIHYPPIMYISYINYSYLKYIFIRVNMGFFDFVKNVAQSAMCTTGMHSGKWSHIHGKPECNVERTCTRCQKHITAKHHNYGEFRCVDSSTCDHVHECVHCNHFENKIMHSYGRVGRDDNCRIIEKCSRCGDEKKGQEDHDWIKLFDREIKLHGKRKCRRCDMFES